MSSMWKILGQAVSITVAPRVAEVRRRQAAAHEAQKAAPPKTGEPEAEAKSPPTEPEAKPKSKPRPTESAPMSDPPIEEYADDVEDFEDFGRDEDFRREEEELRRRDEAAARAEAASQRATAARAAATPDLAAQEAAARAAQAAAQEAARQEVAQVAAAQEAARQEAARQEAAQEAAANRPPRGSAGSGTSSRSPAMRGGPARQEAAADEAIGQETAATDEAIGQEAAATDEATRQEAAAIDEAPAQQAIVEVSQGPAQDVAKEVTDEAAAGETAGNSLDLGIRVRTEHDVAGNAANEYPKLAEFVLWVETHAHRMLDAPDHLLGTTTGVDPNALAASAVPIVETPLVETPLVETPSAETPSAETPLVEASLVETPLVESSELPAMDEARHAPAEPVIPPPEVNASSAEQPNRELSDRITLLEMELQSLRRTYGELETERAERNTDHSADLAAVMDERIAAALDSRLLPAVDDRLASVLEERLEAVLEQRVELRMVKAATQIDQLLAPLSSIVSSLVEKQVAAAESRIASMIDQRSAAIFSTKIHAYATRIASVIAAQGRGSEERLVAAEKSINGRLAYYSVVIRDLVKLTGAGSDAEKICSTGPPTRPPSAPRGYFTTPPFEPPEVTEEDQIIDWLDDDDEPRADYH